MSARDLGAGPVRVPECDNASVGVLIRNAQSRWLMFERVQAPIGVAPVAGHVWDGHAEAGTDAGAAYQAAACEEVVEELGLAVLELADTGVGGWRANRCRRPAGPRGIGHQWRVYRATVTGTLDPSEAEARNLRWLTQGHLQVLADLTITYALGHIDQDEWATRPGIEPVWVDWLAQLGLIQVSQADLELVDLVAQTGRPAAGGGPR